MAKTLIDQLILKLGLDPEDFTKGQKKAAESLIDFEHSAKKSSASIGGSIASLGARFLTFAAAVYAVKKAWNIVTDTATNTRRLGQDARNYGQAANELRNFENAIEITGGKAEEARQSVAGFEKAMFDLAYQGTVSESLVQLARLGVQFQDSSGHARKFTDVVLDTADALDKAQKRGTMDRASAYQYALSAGFDSGTANLVVNGRAATRAELTAQEKRRQISGRDVAAATTSDRSRIDRNQDIEVAKVEVMTASAPVVAGLNKFADIGVKLLTGQEKTTDAVKDVDKTLGGNGGKGKPRAASDLDDLSRLGLNPRTSVGLRRHNPMNIMQNGQVRQYATFEQGLRAGASQLHRYIARGNNTIEGIVRTWTSGDGPKVQQAYIDDVYRRTQIAKGKQVNDSDIPELVSAMSAHDSGYKVTGGEVADLLSQYQQQYGAPLGADAQPTPGVQASNVTNTTEVQIDSITINTQATDARGVVRDLNGEMNRKLLASHPVGQGMN